MAQEATMSMINRLPASYLLLAQLQHESNNSGSQPQEPGLALHKPSGGAGMGWGGEGEETVSETHDVRPHGSGELVHRDVSRHPSGPNSPLL
ncbi:hypothetical protein NDU88_006290 [Pleurodeles waltl]|uniref:Uncharacterized protein n=1 Tax=Pleurodeles waltl TaxID=8319 RepID=A0AAV7LUG7_PLEWA|nr:hypothetical protein NDU88_006290 [Pleurodeles waltl]